MTAMAALNAPIGGAPSDSTYLGIPNGYVPKVPANDQSGLFDTNVNPNPYAQGDQFTPGIGQGPDAIAEMQQDLMKAGLIPKGTQFRIGVWDSVTADAYKKALEFANQQGVQAGQAIDTLINAPQYDNTQTKPLQYELPDRDTVKAGFRKMATQTLGRQTDSNTEEAFASAYEQKLMEIQQQNYQQQAIDGAKLYEAPDQATFAEQQLRAQNPGEAQAHDFSNQYNAFSNLLQQSANIKSY